LPFPGTVIGVSYIIAFNVPPIELTGTAAILVICFVFRNMPVGVRSGIASLSQIDKSLDEASLTLGRSWTTFRRITLPLIRPAILSALVYSFVRSMTAISAVIFLVSAKHDMATSYIIGRVENNEYGVAIAYSTVLIVVMLAAIGLFQWIVGSDAGAARHAPGFIHDCRRRMNTSTRKGPARVVFDKVTKRYGTNVTAVDQISLDFPAGTLVTLLGPSGCGKTTTLRMIAGLEMATSGRILIGGDDVTKLPATRATCRWCSSPTRCSRT
jgi:ABC-type multidrug transport system fused ATPase/permease subunit